MEHRIEKLIMTHPELDTVTFFEVVEVINGKPHKDSSGKQTFKTREDAQAWIDRQ